MRHARIVGVALLAALALCAISVSTASATEFIYSKTGKLTGKALTTEEFKLGNANLVCEEVRPSGEVQLKFHELPLTFNYGKCSIEGMSSATVTAADYTWLLPPAVTLGNAIDARAAIFGTVCSLVIAEGQSLGVNPGEIAYENNSGKIVINTKITGIDYEITESTNQNLCGHVGEKGTNGTLTGKDQISLEGGTIEVK